MKKNAVITGAGSGVGRAIAVAMARQGWQVALVGRTGKTLNETARLTGQSAADVLVCACDISAPAEVEKMARLVRAKLGAVEVLVNAAGTNTPNRSLELLTFEKYREL